MNNKLFAGLAMALLTTLGSQLSNARAQNTVFTYQGQVLDNGSAFTGTGQFQFGLVTSTNNNHTAMGTANAPSGGYITGYNVVTGGSGYVTAPAVTVSGGGGAGATATATLNGSGAVNHISVASTGNGGYTSAPTVTVAPPPPAITYTTYWSNDGMSVNGSEPAAVVAIGVTNGLFTVVLGDTNLPNMDAISAALFNQPGLQLQIWFNDGTHGFATLNPVQNLTPTPYAVYAANAGSVAATNIVGTLPGAQLPASVITNGASGVTITGTFSGNGTWVTNVPLGALNGNGLISWGNFQLSSSPDVGFNPSSVIAADVNGDGFVDLISADSYDSTLTVLTNNGFGVFGSNATLNIVGGPIDVVAADVNGDGHVDLISANINGNTLLVLTNNGLGVFGSNATLHVGNGPTCVIAADVNEDGHVDLTSANEGASTLTVLTNNGFGVFGSNATLNVGSGPECVIAADVKGDGRVDLVSANYNDNTLTVLTNNGFGVFGSNATLHVSHPYSVCAADVNGDGHADLINANTGIDTLTVFTNNGFGVFGSNATLNIVGSPISVIAADVNGDGRVDLVSASLNSKTLTVLTNNGFGVFGSNATLNVGNGPDGPDFVCAADVNGDGHVDLIAANGYETLSVLLNVPAYSGTFSGNGSGLTSLNAANLTGSIPTGVSVPAGSLTGTIADGLLSANVALRAGGNAFTGNQTVTSGNVGIGSTTPEGLLEIQGGADGSGANDQHDIALAYRDGGFRHWIRTRHDAIVTGNPTDNAIDFFVNNSTSAAGSSAPGTGSVLVMSLNGGNVGISNAEPKHLLVVGSAGSPAYCDGTTWVNGSDRNSKEAFTAIDPCSVLDKVSALPISEWKYKVEADGTRHLGPVAQDFHAAFGLNGADDTHIATIDEEGVALAAIQGLNQKLEDKSQKLEKENAELKQRLEALEKIILPQKSN